MRRPETYRIYDSIVRTHIAPSPIAHLPLQRLRGTDLERYYAESKAAPSSLVIHHAILHRALRKAVKDGVLAANPAVDLERRKVTPSQASRNHCWSVIEARRVIEVAKTAAPQLAAYVFLALDTGARKSELDGLGWEHVDLDAGVLHIVRQLDAVGEAPVFGPTKTKQPRSVSLTPETVEKLRAHKQRQAELKMRNRTSYTDFGLVFAREEADLMQAQVGARAAARDVERESVSDARQISRGQAHQVPRGAAHGGDPVSASGDTAACGRRSTGAFRDGADADLRTRPAQPAAGRRGAPGGVPPWLVTTVRVALTETTHHRFPRNHTTMPTVRQTVMHNQTRPLMSLYVMSPAGLTGC